MRERVRAATFIARANCRHVERFLMSRLASKKRIGDLSGGCKIARLYGFLRVPQGEVRISDSGHLGA